MNPEDTAKASATATSKLASGFMLDGQTYKRGAELGFEGATFYFAGRGGVLGDVDADVVSAAFYFFNPQTLRAAWEATQKVMSRHDAAAAFAACAHEWGRSHVADKDAAERLAELAGRAVAAASPAGAPIFAGWRALPVPSDPQAAAIHHMNGLRELRMAAHAAAVTVAGVAPRAAVCEHTPHMAALFGWEPIDGDGPGADWDEIEATTDRAFAATFLDLTDSERAEFVELADAVYSASA